MISKLKGVLDESDEGLGASVIVVLGVGYAVVFCDRDQTKMGGFGKGAIVEVFVRQIVTEDSHTLYGFCDAMDRRAFDKLVKLDGVGPKTALLILSTMGWEEFAALIKAGDVVALQKIKGIGAKTAAKLLKTKV